MEKWEIGEISELIRFEGIGGKEEGGLHAKACNQHVDGRPVARGDSFLFSAGVVRAHVDVHVGFVQV